MPKIIFQPLMIANPLERLTGDFLIENQPERLAEE